MADRSGGSGGQGVQRNVPVLRQLHQLFVLPPLPQRLRSPTAQALRATLAPGEAALDISLAEFARRCAVAG